jgi:hypothetical protein
MTAELVPDAGGTGASPVPPAQMLAIYAEYQAAQNLLGVTLIRDILARWNLTAMDLGRIKRIWPQIRAGIAAAVDNKHDVFWNMGLRFFAQVRGASGITSPVPEVLPVPLPPALVQATLDSTGPWTMLRAVSKSVPPGQAADIAAVRLSGAASRLAIQGARQAVLAAVQADPAAMAWARGLGPRPCYFCAMLASRGPVFKSEASAGFEAHNHCMCYAIPCFSAGQGAPGWQQLQDDWQRVTKGLSGQDARKAWRHYWDSGHPAVLPLAA